MLKPLLKSKKNVLPIAVIIDLDGTLANIHHRLDFVQTKGKKDWKKFFEQMGKDTINEWCKFIANTLPIQKILVTGRPANYREITEKWLNKNEIKYDLLLMRKKGDFRQDSIIKREIYEQEIRNKYEILFVIDDRMQVVKMWRELGLVCLQCDEGNY